MKSTQTWKLAALLLALPIIIFVVMESVGCVRYVAYTPYRVYQERKLQKSREERIRKIDKAQAELEATRRSAEMLKNIMKERGY